MIKTREDWWQLCNERWADLLECAALAGAPLSSRMWSEDGLSAPVDHPRTLVATVEAARINLDYGAVHHFLNLVWMCAPDKPYIHRWPSWGALCDLCSEIWVFYEEDPQQ